MENAWAFIVSRTASAMIMTWDISDYDVVRVDSLGVNSQHRLTWIAPTPGRVIPERQDFVSLDVISNRQVDQVSSLGRRGSPREHQESSRNQEVHVRPLHPDSTEPVIELQELFP